MAAERELVIDKSPKNRTQAHVRREARDQRPFNNHTFTTGMNS
jgi:hypothetical protein